MREWKRTAEAALERYRGLTSAIFRIPAFAGYCYTQLTDVEQEVNGFMTYDRKPQVRPQSGARHQQSARQSRPLGEDQILVAGADRVEHSL